MRTTDDRYRGENARFDLAMRMIAHEARTGTIRYLTGLSDDRIRKLYTSYFKYDSSRPIKRRRGKTPTQITPLISTPARALESGVFVNLLLTNGLVCIDEPPGPALRGNVQLGNRFCDCYEIHREIIPSPTLTFEWAWNLLNSVRRGDEIGMELCASCETIYLRDLLTLPPGNCPACPTLRHRSERSSMQASRATV